MPTRTTEVALRMWWRARLCRAARVSAAAMTAGPARRQRAPVTAPLIHLGLRNQKRRGSCRGGFSQKLVTVCPLPGKGDEEISIPDLA